jgi:hydroxyethylthiazole kinase-like uncharacterized protein yjeF
VELGVTQDGADRRPRAVAAPFAAWRRADWFYDRFVRSVITPAEAARLDAEASEPIGILMERAGYGVAMAAVGMGMRYGSRVVVLAGPGNNGGDGYVAARVLHERGVGVEVQALAVPRTDACAAAATSARRAGVPMLPLENPSRPVDLVIDAVFGGGFRRGLPEGLAAWMELPVPVLAVDVPTGLDPDGGLVADQAFSANVTVTFHALKTGHVLGQGPDRCGDVRVVDIGLGEERPALLVVGAEDSPRPGRARTAHKWSAGSVLVAGGAPGMVGAAVMAGRAALHFGAGAVGLAVPDPALAQGLAPELLAHPLDPLPDRYQVLVIGPGLGGEGGDVVKHALAGERAMVLDADGLGRVDVETLASAGGPVVVTPHAGEFRRLTGQAPSLEAVHGLAARTGAVVVLKGNPTFVSDGSLTQIVRSGGPELATIGTGDVLAGMIAALLARGLPPVVAASSGVYWHGVAGRALGRSGTVTADRLATQVGRFAWDEPT